MSVFNFSKKKDSLFTKDELYKAGVCPNCWSSQELEGQYIVYSQAQSNAARLHNPKAFIQKFVDERVTGIKLVKEDQGQHCPKCGG